MEFNFFFLNNSFNDDGEASTKILKRSESLWSHRDTLAEF